MYHMRKQHSFAEVAENTVRCPRDQDITNAMLRLDMLIV